MYKVVKFSELAVLPRITNSQKRYKNYATFKVHTLNTNLSIKAFVVPSIYIADIYFIDTTNLQTSSW